MRYRFLIHYFIVVMISSVLINACRGSQVPGPTTEGDIKRAIDSESWVFTVEQVIPLYGRSRQANGDYTVVYNGGMLKVYLPYFGRATAGIDVYTGRGPLDFSSDKPVIDQQQPKPGEWRIGLRPDNREIQIMDFTFYSNGTAHLSVRLSSRSAISYRGNVRPFTKSKSSG
jgi:hypothetical protein